MSDKNLTIGGRIRFHRKRRNIRQTELAQWMNVRQSTISGWERDILNIPAQRIVGLSKILGVQPGDLLNNVAA